jgi:agmatine deiminase
MIKNNRRLPAEWEKHQGILLCFPHNGNDWPGKFGAIQWAFVEFIKKVAASEQVFLIVANTQQQKKVSGLLETAHVNMAQVSFIIQKTNRSWMRDSGPIIVKNGTLEREALNFNFNGWAKYNNWQLDKHVPANVADFLKMPITQVV